MLPRMVSGPTQKSRDAVSHPSMNRSRAACASSGGLPVGRVHPSRHRGSGERRRSDGQPFLDAQQRADDAADEQRAEDDEHRGARSHRARPATRSVTLTHGQAGDEDGDESKAVGDDGAGPLGQPVTDGHPEERADDDGHDVDERAETGESRSRTSVTLRWR